MRVRETIIKEINNGYVVRYIENFDTLFEKYFETEEKALKDVAQYYAKALTQEGMKNG